MTTPITGFHTKVGKIGRSLGIHAIAFIERPQLPFLLIITCHIHFHIDPLEPLVTCVPNRSDTQRSVCQRLHGVRRDGINLPAPMLCQKLQRHIKMERRSRLIQLIARRESHRKRLLMHIFAKDETFPIHPHIQIEPAGSIKHLKPHFRVGRQVQFRIVKRLDQAMVRRTIQTTQYNIDMLGQGQLCPKPRQDMKSLLILFPFPRRHVLIGHTRILVGSPKTQRMDTRFQLQIGQRIINRFGLKPQAGQCIALHERTLIFVVLEKTQIINFDRKLAFPRRIDPAVGSIHPFGNLCVERPSSNRYPHEKRSQHTKAKEANRLYRFHLFFQFGCKRNNSHGI